jgi:predicted enzyme related to lactoylglutathione lyase
MSNNRVVHFEIPANEPKVLTKFYAELFGGKFQRAPIPGVEYWNCETGTGPGINGAIMKRQNDGQPWMNYVDVPSIDAALETTVKLGARVALPKMPVSDMGAVGAIMDPEGNICGLWDRTKSLIRYRAVRTG